jgi:hypothetical protein
MTHQVTTTCQRAHHGPRERGGKARPLQDDPLETHGGHDEEQVSDVGAQGGAADPVAQDVEDGRDRQEDLGGEPDDLHQKIVAL